MYNIKQAAERAGVTVPVLRAWERRYGIVRPARTPSGYRLFDDESVARVRAMRALIEDGWTARNAAATILAGGAPAMDTVETAATPDALVPAAEADEGSALGARLVDAAQALDPDAIGSVLDEMFSRGSFERVMARLVFPALERLGDAWAAGRVSVAGEHLASNAVLRRLALALEAAGGPGGGPRIVVGLPPGGRHELGALAFAVAARRAGQAVSYLGPDLPVDDWVTAGREAAAAVIGVVVARDRAPALEVARRLRGHDAHVVIAFGGRAAPSSSTDAVRLSPDLVTAVAELVARVTAGAARA